VIVFNTGLRAIRTVAFVCLFAGTALGQSVLNSPGRLPQILKINPILPVGPDGVRRIIITGQNFDGNATLTVGGRVVPMVATSTGGQYAADLPPDLELGYISVRVRVGGLESRAYPLPVLPDAPFVQRSGHAVYQKVEVTETGLDPTRSVNVPIRGARVEVFDPVLGQLISASETNEQGEFLVAVPANRIGLAIRVLSRLRSAEVKVLDNTMANRLYVLSHDLGDPDDTDEIDLVETTRASGAFNILDTIQRANALVALSDPQFTTPPLTIYWSERNNESVLARLTGGAIRSTFFSLAANTAYILGDRSTDSDEFDDSVILHEYAHMLAARFSRDDSPGGPHVIGDILDPRLAWSEGWANFFSAAVRGTSIYLDTKGPGAPAVRYDFEEDSPANDRPGYWSEASVDGLLWDLFDDNQDNVDTAQFPFSSIWAAFTDLRNVRYVYLPYFLEAFLVRNPGFSDGLRAMVIRRSIDFQPYVRPSVVNPFPRPIAVGETRAGNDVDSFTARRANLALSSHFWSFSTPTGGIATVTLNIDGLGPANNPNANDLDLFLYDGNGKRIEISDRALNGQPEIISGVRLNPGTYYIEVRSFYLNAETNTMVFNSGRYRLSLQLR
jgi:Bacterial pre-peptidase C-terminal domain